MGCGASVTNPKKSGVPDEQRKKVQSQSSEGLLCLSFSSHFHLFLKIKISFIRKIELHISSLFSTNFNGFITRPFTK